MVIPSWTFFFYYFPHVIELGIPLLLFKLGLVEKFMVSTQALEEIEKEIDEIAAAASDAAILERLAKVKNIIVSLEEE